MQLPTVSNRGDDLGYDLYAIEDVTLSPGKTDVSVQIWKGDRIVQLSPFAAMTGVEVVAVKELAPSERGQKGFGSSGR
jgi:dUTPase